MLLSGTQGKVRDGFHLFMPYLTGIQETYQKNVSSFFGYIDDFYLAVFQIKSVFKNENRKQKTFFWMTSIKWVKELPYSKESNLLNTRNIQKKTPKNPGEILNTQLFWTLVLED